MFFKIIDFGKFSSIKIGKPTEVLMLQMGDTVPIDRFIIGHANNLLLSSTPPPLMMLSKDFTFIELQDNILRVGAATPTGKLLSFAKKNNLGGFEFISKLPGSLGGVVAMNGGVKQYEIFDILDEVKIDNKWIKKENIDYGYRYANLGGVVTEIKFYIKRGFNNKLQQKFISLRSNQPKAPSAGSLFKNPKGDYAGRLIEAVGLKGFKRGDMEWSRVHANFLVNNGQGTFNDAIYLIELAKERVFRQFKIKLKKEVKILHI